MGNHPCRPKTHRVLDLRDVCPTKARPCESQVALMQPQAPLRDADTRIGIASPRSPFAGPGVTLPDPTKKKKAAPATRSSSRACAGARDLSETVPSFGDRLVGQHHCSSITRQSSDHPWPRTADAARPGRLAVRDNAISASASAYRSTSSAGLRKHCCAAGEEVHIAGRGDPRVAATDSRDLRKSPNHPKGRCSKPGWPRELKSRCTSRRHDQRTAHLRPLVRKSV